MQHAFYTFMEIEQSASMMHSWWYACKQARTLAQAQPSACHVAVLEEGVELHALGTPRMQFDTYESNVLFVLRFMIDAGVVGGGWVSAPAGKWKLGSAQPGAQRKKLSTCQVDIHMSYRCAFACLQRGMNWRLTAVGCRLRSCALDCLSHQSGTCKARSI